MISNIFKGQKFKNYKELSTFLGEEIKTGKSKQLQLKDWQRYFTFEKEGNKFIITDVYDIPKEKERKKCTDTSKYRSNNNKNILPMVELIRAKNFQYKTDEYSRTNEYYSFTKWYCDDDKLGLFRMSICNIVYQETEDIEEYCKKVIGIENIKVLKEYVSAAKKELKKLLHKTLHYMYQKKLAYYDYSYKFTFRISSKTNGWFVTNKFEKEIYDIETEVCNKLNKKYLMTRQKSMQGRKLLFLIYNNPARKKEFEELKIKAIVENEKLIKELNEEHNVQKGGFDFMAIGSENYPLLGYNRVLRINVLQQKFVNDDDIPTRVCDIIRKKARKAIEKKGFREQDISKVEKGLFIY